MLFYLHWAIKQYSEGSDFFLTYF